MKNNERIIYCYKKFFIKKAMKIVHPILHKKMKDMRKFRTYKLSLLINQQLKNKIKKKLKKKT